MTPWSSWETLTPKTPFTESTLRETLDGGQAFRWECDANTGCYQGTWGRIHAQIRLEKYNTLKARILGEPTQSDWDALSDYLRLDEDWDAIVDQLPWRSDAHLKTAIDAFPGLRLLNQPFPETLLCFLCSATKQIPQIKIMCANLANALGDPIAPDGPKALPTWERIATASEDELRALGLGFRAKNIKKTADQIATDPGVLETIEALPYVEAHARVAQFPGVGSKIADCALLFGARKYDAFPVDTWIIKVLEKRYQLEGWNKTQLEQFGRIHLGPYAGYAQQFLFAYERKAAHKAVE